MPDKYQETGFYTGEQAIVEAYFFVTRYKYTIKHPSVNKLCGNTTI